eukprot:1149420-Pelagomonas_calceolata.AAC.4
MQLHGRASVLMCGRMASPPSGHPWLSSHIAAFSLHGGSLPSLTTMRHVSFIRSLSVSSAHSFHLNHLLAQAQVF